MEFEPLHPAAHRLAPPQFVIDHCPDTAPNPADPPNRWGRRIVPVRMAMV
jgi:hypothetical protein